MPASPKFSIVIVTWNGLNYLKEYLPKVAETNHPSFEIVIADNASTDGTELWLNEHFPKCIHAKFDQNYGYCGGNNRAVDYCNGEIVIFINNDAYPDSNWLNSIEKAFENQSIGSIQPKIKSVKDPQKFEYAGAAGGYLDLLGYPFCAGRIFDEVETDNGQYDSQRSIDWASGAAIAIRKNLFSELGGFEETFEFHMEEIDLCWRVWRAGYQVIYLPTATVYHLGGGSLPMGSPRKVYYNFRNSLFMLVRNLQNHVFLKILFRLTLDGIAALKSLIEGKPADLLAVLKAHFHFYASLPSLISQRKKLNQRLKNSAYKHSPPSYKALLIASFFFKKRRNFADYTDDLTFKEP